MADQTIIFTKNAPARELPCALPPVARTREDLY